MKSTYLIEGMHCAGCVASIEKALTAVAGVQNAIVNLPLEKVSIDSYFFQSRVTFEQVLLPGNAFVSKTDVSV